MAPHTPHSRSARSERPGEAVTLLDTPTDSTSERVAPLKDRSRSDQLFASFSISFRDSVWQREMRPFTLRSEE